MISNKHITKIAAVLIAVAVVLCFVGIGYKDMFPNTAYSVEYESELFDTSKIITLDIQMDEDEWQTMLDNAIKEEYYQCDVTINGTTFYSVGIRPKGNTSLSSIANDPDNNRYSFKLEFDKFVDGQTCFGLDKLVLNNSYADTTNMKEAVIYDMYNFLGADASLYNYTKMSVNGEYWGVYLALEAVEDSFMLRNYGMEKGYLYKPDSMNMTNKDEDNQGGGRPEGGMPQGERPEMPDGEVLQGEMPEMPDGEMPHGEMPEMPDGEMPQGGMPGGGQRGGGPGGGMGSGGADLNYSDDNTDSYSTIWDGEVTKGSTESDHKRVVTALKNIHDGTDLEKYLDIDNILKYMAVHSFSVNDDSLSGAMAHNYYLYESGGMLNVIPWDYNLAFGGMNGGSASDIVNDAIDNYFNLTEFFDAVFENEKYKARYHEYYSKLVDEYIYGGKFEETYQRIRSQIDELVQTDPNYMYTYEEYTAGADMLYNTVMLRAESVKGQLDGTIPSTADGQQEDASSLVDASAIDISVMGVMNGGGRGGHGGGRMGGRGGMPPGGAMPQR